MTSTDQTASDDSSSPDIAGYSQATKAILAGRESCGGALAPTLWSSTTFQPGTIAQARKLATQPRPTHFYSRYGNPTVADFENAVAELEGAEAARAFSSGMGALSSVIFAMCSQGAHIVATKQLFGGTRQLLDSFCPRFGIEVTFVDGTEPGAIAEAVVLGKTILVIAETPANPRLDLVDLDELGAIQGPFTVVDSTFATPLGQNPLAHGVDMVIHSATKAISGHNDATLGVLCGPTDLVDWIAGFSALQGTCPSPADALNGLRGIRTLPVRLRQQTATAHALAADLEGHAAISEVRYPGLPSHPQYELAQRQLRTAGGLVSFELRGGQEAGETFIQAVKLAIHAPSLGGPETLVTHPASTTHAGLDPDQLAEAFITPGTIRVSCGLEDPVDVVADFVQALDQVVAAGK